MKDRHAYLIMAHNQWEILQELLETLDDPHNDIYLHIDKKASAPREQINACVRNAQLTYTKQYNIVWGGTQMMECTLSMLEEASKEYHSHYHFISGTDFPIKSQNDIHKFFEEHLNTEFISFDWAGINSGRFLDRAKYYHFLINIIGKRDNRQIIYRVLTKLEDVSLALQRKFGTNRLDYTMYKGSSWFSITHSLVNEILKRKDAILTRYKFTANADETWLQTFVMETNYKHHLADTNMRYIKWVQGNPSPETLTMLDFEDLISADKLFARKFDWQKDYEIIMRLKEHISKG
jgi:hypothetical protein